MSVYCKLQLQPQLVHCCVFVVATNTIDTLLGPLALLLPAKLTLARSMLNLMLFRAQPDR